MPEVPVTNSEHIPYPNYQNFTLKKVNGRNHLKDRDLTVTHFRKVGGKNTVKYNGCFEGVFIEIDTTPSCKAISNLQHCFSRNPSDKLDDNRHFKQYLLCIRVSCRDFHTLLFLVVSVFKLKRIPSFVKYNGCMKNQHRNCVKYLRILKFCSIGREQGW